MSDIPSGHPDAEIVEASTPFKRFLRVDVFRFRHRLFSGEWSALRSYDAAGLVDTSESSEAVAVRETREETGLVLLSQPVPIQRYLSSAGASDESVFLFCGHVDSTAAFGVHGLPGEHEDIRVVVKTLAEIETLLDQGAIESGHTLIGHYWLLRHRDRLRRLWRGPTG